MPTDRARATRVLGASDLHLVERFSYGITPRLAGQVRRAGGAAAWFAAQLEPARGADPADDYSLWWPYLAKSPDELWEASRAKEMGGGEVMADLQNFVLLRRIHSERQVLEVMTEVWENHFNVPVREDKVFTWRRDYGDVVRAHALGTFRGLLRALEVHPAMLLFLDAAVNDRDKPNENLGRELLELHTVGIGEHDEDDVKAAARVLTGWYVDPRTFAASYETARHWTGPLSVVDWSHDNADPDGRAVTDSLLDHLARHPATARRVCRMLAVKFVSDTPSDALVESLAAVYLAEDTAIVPVLQHLVASDEFAAARGAKVRDPAADLVATYRAVRPRFSRPPSGTSGRRHAANMLNYQSSTMGSAPGAWPQPDGQPIDNASWASPARMIASLRMHWYVANGYFPSKGIRYRTPQQWLPAKRVRFDDLVDHMSRELLGRKADKRLVRACAKACKITRPSERIHRRHALVKWHFGRLTSTILDTPEHFTR